MADNNISIYLNDHLAGSVIALEMLEFLQKTQAGTAMEQVLAKLQAEVAADRQTLESLMARLQITESRTRKATAWLAEKLSELKFKVDDPSGELHLLQTFDILLMGIEGKTLLWRALAAASTDAPVLKMLDYENLMQRAETQRRQLSEIRLSVARAALGKMP